MSSFILRCIVVAGVLGSLGCTPFGGRWFSGNSDRIHVVADDNDAISPGVKASWEVYPRTAGDRQGLFDLQHAATSPAPDRSGDDATQHEGGAGADGVSVSGKASARPEPEPPRRFIAMGPISLDFEYSAGIGGDDDDFLSPPDFVDYDGTRFSAPQRLQYSYDLHMASIGARAGPRFLDVFSVELLTGLSTSVLDLVIRAPGERAGDTGVAIGAHIGARGTITPHPTIDFYGQWALHLLGSTQSERNLVSVRAAEVGSNLHLTSNVSLFGGWRWLKYEEDIDHGSDMDVDLAGPTFGLLFRF